MEKLTFNEIKTILDELADRRSSNFTYERFINDHSDMLQIKTERDMFLIIAPDYRALADRLGPFHIVAQHDRDLDEYSTNPIFYVYYFENHDIYMKVHGWWNSYNGESFDHIEEVKPVTKTITVYE